MFTVRSVGVATRSAGSVGEHEVTIMRQAQDQWETKEGVDGEERGGEGFFSIGFTWTHPCWQNHVGI